MSTRELFQQVKITQEWCDNTYGVAPCTAVVGVSGTTKCYNTRATCQDRENYIVTDRDITFCKQNENAPRDGVTMIPSVVSVSTNPTTLNIAAASTDQGPLGRRATVKVTLMDHPYHDRLVDPYWQERDFDPMTRSTFWAKWLVRNPYHKNYPLRIVESDLTGQLTTRTRNYLIDRVDLAANGKVTITAKDILAPLSEAMLPNASSGTLGDDITAGQTSFVVQGGTSYPTSGHLRIDDEILTFTRSGSNFTVTRGVGGTTAAEHGVDSPVQLAVQITGRVDAVVAILMVLGGVNPAYINVDDQWTDEADKWLAPYNVTTIISEPTKISTLIGELLEQCSCVTWWDEVNQVIPFKAVRPYDPVLDTLVELNGDEHVKIESVGLRPRPEQRVDQVWFYYGIRSFAGELDKPSNFTRARITVAALAQQNYRTEDTPQVKEIYSRWLPAGALGLVVTTSTRIITRLQDTPTDISFALDAKDRAVYTGDVVRLTVRNLVDFTGASLPQLLQITSTEDAEEGHSVEYMAVRFGLQQRTAFITPNDYPVYSLATQDQKDNGAWISNNDGTMPNGDPGYLLS
jgi:hypothetical protein